MNGRSGLGGWQWLFLIEAIPAVLLGFITLIYLPDGPNRANWLNAEEKKWIISTLDRERQQTASHGDHSMRAALASARVWTFALIYFAIIMSFYGVTFWLPQIVKAFSGTTDLFVGLISAVPWLGATIGMIMLSRNSDATGERRRHVAFSAIAGAIGLITAGLLNNPGLELAALSLAAAG